LITNEADIKILTTNINVMHNTMGQLHIASTGHGKRVANSLENCWQYSNLFALRDSLLKNFRIKG
jgi:hypothetical protein